MATAQKRYIGFFTTFWTIFNKVSSDQPKEFFAKTVRKLLKKWDKYINVGGDYGQK